MNTLLLRCTLLSTFAATLAAQSPITVAGTVKVADMSRRDALPPLSPPSESVTLKPAAAGGKAPAGLADVRMGTVTLGGRTLAVAVGKTAADKPHFDALCIDGDGDGTFSDAERQSLDVTARPGQNNRPAGESAKPVDCTLALGKAKLAARANYLRMGDADPTVMLQFPSYLEATVRIGDAEHVIAIADKDLDGAFGSKGDLWTLGKPGDRPASAFALSLLGERRFTAGQLVGITVAPDNQITVTMAAADGPDPKDAAAHRVRVEHQWSERFDKERADFVAQRKLDTSRPRASKPIDWQYVTFEQALAMGAKANKPVFVDVMAFWCVWCYRMDYYTYVDAEVAELLGTQFIPCKILQEQDLAGDYDAMMKRLEARGIPAMGIFDAEGKVLHKIGGWKDPVAFLADLEQGLAAFQGK